MKKDKLTLGIVLSIVFLLVLGVTYAYFSLVVTGNDTASDIVIEMGELSLTYSDGTQVIAHEIEPGWNYTKTVTVTNNGSSGTVYKMYYATLLNQIFGEDSSTSNSEMHISATCMSSENTYCDGIEEKSVVYSNTETTNQVIKEDIYIAPGETQTYEITFKFVNTNYNQNYNQGKSFYAQINIGDDTTMYNVNVTAYEGENLIENFNYEMHSTPRSGSTTTGTFSENNVELGSHTVTLTNGSDVYTGEFDLRTSESKGQYSLTAYAEEGQNTADIILYFNDDKELESIEIDGGNEKHPLRPIAGTLAQNWQIRAGYRPSTGSTTTTEEGLKVQSITFYDDGRTFSGITPIDVSSTNDRSILLYQEETTECAPVNTGTDSSPVWTTPSACYNDYIVADGRIDFPVNTSYLFYYSINTNKIDFNNSVNTSNVTNMLNMFFNAGYNANTFYIENIDNWDTSKVTNMSQMFYKTGSISMACNIGELSEWDTSKVETMSSMFYYSGYNASTWDIGDINNWDTSNVTNMGSMFRYAGRNATTWNIGELSKWDVSSVTDMSYMFSSAGYSAISWNIGDLGKWDVSNVIKMPGMFQYAGYSTQVFDIGNIFNWNVSKVTNMEFMFNYTGSSATYTLDLSGWSVPLVTSHSNFNSGVSSKVISPVWAN